MEHLGTDSKKVWNRVKDYILNSWMGKVYFIHWQPYITSEVRDYRHPWMDENVFIIF